MTDSDQPGFALRETTPAEPVLASLERLGRARDEVDTQLDVDLAAKRMFGALQPEPRIGRFEVLEVVGSGGMGVVYAAWDPGHAREVAIKVVNDVAASERSSDDAEARLAREGRVASRLTHPNIVTVHEYGVHEGRVYVVMDLIDGLSLDRWLTAAPRSWAEILSVFLAAGEGLAAAHAAGIVHRDFKPANVLVDADDHARVVDFGLARPIDGHGLGSAPQPGPLHAHSYQYTITATGRIGGTPAYMAPELFKGARPAPSADVYAFCVSLLEASRVTTDTVPGQSIDVLLRGIEPDPSARWPDMRSLLESLRRRMDTLAGPFALLRALIRSRRDA